MNPKLENVLEQKNNLGLGKFVTKVISSMSPAKLKSMAMGGLLFLSAGSMDAANVSDIQNALPDSHIYHAQNNSEEIATDTIPLEVVQSPEWEYVQRIQDIATSMDSAQWQGIFNDFDNYKKFFTEDFTDFLVELDSVTNHQADVEDLMLSFPEKIQNEYLTSEYQRQDLLEVSEVIYSSGMVLDISELHYHASNFSLKEKAINFYSQEELVSFQKILRGMGLRLDLYESPELQHIVVGDDFEDLKNLIIYFVANFSGESLYKYEDELVDFFNKNLNRIKNDPEAAAHLLGSIVLWGYRTEDMKNSPVPGSALSFLVDKRNLDYEEEPDYFTEQWYKDKEFVALAMKVEGVLYSNPDSMLVPELRLAAHHIYATTYNIQRLFPDGDENKRIEEMVSEAQVVMEEAFEQHKDHEVFKNADITLLADGYDPTFRQSFHRGKEIEYVSKDANSFFYGISYDLSEKEELSPYGDSSTLVATYDFVSFSKKPVLLLHGHGRQENGNTDFMFNQGDPVSPEDLVDLIKECKDAKTRSFVFSLACFSGSYVQDVSQIIESDSTFGFSSMPILVGNTAPNEPGFARSSSAKIGETTGSFLTNIFRNMAQEKGNDLIQFQDFFTAAKAQFISTEDGTPVPTRDLLDEILPTILVPITIDGKAKYIMLHTTIGDE